MNLHASTEGKFNNMPKMLSKKVGVPRGHCPTNSPGPADYDSRRRSFMTRKGRGCSVTARLWGGEGAGGRSLRRLKLSR